MLRLLGLLWLAKLLRRLDGRLLLEPLQRSPLQCLLGLLRLAKLLRWLNRGLLLKSLQHALLGAKQLRGLGAKQLRGLLIKRLIELLLGHLLHLNFLQSLLLHLFWRDSGHASRDIPHVHHGGLLIKGLLRLLHVLLATVVLQPLHLLAVLLLKRLFVLLLKLHLSLLSLLFCCTKSGIAFKLCL